MSHDERIADALREMTAQQRDVSVAPARVDLMSDSGEAPTLSDWKVG